MDRVALEEMVREELVVEARRVGVKRPEVMTRVELMDEVLRLGTPNPVERKQVRGWLGVARDLLASAVEVGLNLPDAAAMIRGDLRFEALGREQPPVATVTLAEIYGAQGHFDRAIGMLDEVLEREADHEIARRLRTRLVADRDAKRGKPPVPTPDAAPPMAQEPEHIVPAAALVREEEPLVGEEEPLVGEEEPLVGEEEPLVGEEEPLVGEEEPLVGEEEPEHATLVPVKPDPAEFGENDDDAPDLATLVPMKPLATELDDGDDDAPDLATLVPMKPFATEFAENDESELATLVPVRPEPADLDTSDQAVTLFPTHAAAPEEADSDELPTNPPMAPGETAVLLTRTGTASARVYFELGELAHSSGETVVLRIVEHRLRAAGVERVARDLKVSGARGITTVLDLEHGSVLRAALGRKWDGKFRPVAVAAEVVLAESGIDVAWAPRKGIDYGAIAGRSGLTALGEAE